MRRGLYLRRERRIQRVNRVFKEFFLESIEKMVFAESIKEQVYNEKYHTGQLMILKGHSRPLPDR